MVHPGVVQHLKIDLIGIQKAEECPESEEDCPLQPIDLTASQLA
jgi:hypothetical protein